MTNRAKRPRKLHNLKLDECYCYHGAMSPLVISFCFFVSGDRMQKKKQMIYVEHHRQRLAAAAASVTAAHKFHAIDLPIYDREKSSLATLNKSERAPLETVQVAEVLDVSNQFNGSMSA